MSEGKLGAVQDIPPAPTPAALKMFMMFAGLEPQEELQVCIGKFVCVHVNCQSPNQPQPFIHHQIAGMISGSVDHLKRSSVFSTFTNMGVAGLKTKPQPTTRGPQRHFSFNVNPLL